VQPAAASNNQAWIECLDQQQQQQHLDLEPTQQQGARSSSNTSTTTTTSSSSTAERGWTLPAGQWVQPYRQYWSTW
jgi:hypothetical protein